MWFWSMYPRLPTGLRNEWKSTTGPCQTAQKADGGLLVNFHKHAEIAAWHQRNNDRSLQNSFHHMVRSDQGNIKNIYQWLQRREATFTEICQASSHKPFCINGWVYNVRYMRSNSKLVVKCHEMSYEMLRIHPE